MHDPALLSARDCVMQVVPSIGLTYALYALLVQDWGIGGIRSFTHLNQQDEADLAADAA